MEGNIADLFYRYLCIEDIDKSLEMLNELVDNFPVEVSLIGFQYPVGDVKLHFL